MKNFRLLVINDSLQTNPELLKTLDIHKLDHFEAQSSDNIDVAIEELSPDLILYDCICPTHGINHTQTVIQAAYNKEIPVILISNIHTFKLNFNNLLQKGCHLLPKPYHTLDLVSKIHSALFVKLRKNLVHAARV